VLLAAGALLGELAASGRLTARAADDKAPESWFDKTLRPGDIEEVK
jgi:hypothetical protein